MTFTAAAKATPQLCMQEPSLCNIAVRSNFGTTISSLRSMSQQAQHYAFVASSEPLVVPQLEGEETNKNTNQQPLAPPPPTTQSASSPHPQESLVALYQSYAERFPNPHLIQEYQDRDQLLQATSAAHSAVHHSSNVQQQQKKKKGFFGRLFGGGGNDAEESSFTSREALRQAAANHPDDDCLVYTDPPPPAGTEQDDDSLCGTHHHSLDRSCIPQDAHSMARLSLVSQRTRQERPHVVRSSPHLPSEGSTLCIVGLGMIAEWNPSHDNNNNEDNTSMHMKSNCCITSDRVDLLRFAEKKRSFDLSLVRAVSFGPNFLLVSWGFNDGVVVFYRRIALANNNNSNDDTSLGIAWESVVFLGPSSAVLEHSMDVFAEDDGDDSGSDLLRITDMAPLVVTTPGMPAAALAVSRLGGYMEVLPLPPDLWLGPVLDASRHKPRSTKRKRGQHHYAKEHLVNIASDRAPIPILALTTMEYHLDILCLEVIRTRVTMDTVWDRELYGNAPPPAEYILVASGTQKGHEVLTFWAITYMFAEEPPTDGSAGFTLHAVLQEALDIGSMGADLSIFANRAIMDQWRQPRKVSLKERPKTKPPSPIDEDGNPLLEGEIGEDNTVDSLLGDDQVNVQPSVYDRVTTITTSAPIVAMQAIVVPVSTEMGDTDFVSMLSLLDWNGSVTVLDCSGLERMISHSLTEEEYAEIHDADMAGDQQGEPPPPVVLVKTLIERSRMMRWMKHSSTTGSMRSCVSVQWLTRTDNPSDPWLVLLNTTPTSRKQHNQITILSGLLELDEVHQDAVIQSVPFPISQASLQGSVSAVVVPDGTPSPSNLLRLIFQPKRRANNLCVCLLQPLQPRDIILSLARENKYEKAIQAARQLSQEDKQQSKVLEECRQKLWEQSFDLHWLKQVSDSAYIIQQAFLLLENNKKNGKDEGEDDKLENETMEGDNRTDNMNLDTCREIYTLALQRASKIRLSYALTLGQDGEDLKDKLEGIIVRLGTFQLICQALSANASFAKFKNFFMQVSIVDLARSFASAGDITALSILCFRHKKELQEYQLELLSQLPMTLKIRNYCYLLPVLSGGDQQGSDRANSFIADISPCEGDVLRHTSQLPVFLKQEMDIQVVLNNDDEKMILGRNSTINKSDDALPVIEFQVDDVVAFLSSRATNMQRFVGDLQEVADFCTVALVALGGSSDSGDAKLFSGDSASHSLFCTRGCALGLKRMLEESIGDSPLEVAESGLIDLSPFASITPIDLASMELVDVVKMVLGGQDDAETIFEIYRQHLAPLLEYLPRHQVNHLDRAIHDFCVELVRSEIQFGSNDERDVNVDVGNLSEGENNVANMQVDDTPLMALRTCTAIVTGSRTSIRKSDRIIGDKEILISLVLTTVNDVSKRCLSQRFSKGISLEVVKLLWDMYESLPVPTPGKGTNTPSYSDLMSKADHLYRDLVGLEILSQWPGVHIFAFIGKRVLYRGESPDEDSCQRVNDVGQEALVSICRSFCSQARKQKGSVGLSSLLRDLVSDVKQFFEVCYKKDTSFLPVLVHTLSSELIAPLSRQAEFDLVAQFLTGVDKSWWDHEQEGRIIGSYVDSIVFADGSNETSAGDHSLQAAIACQDALGPLFPSLQDGFQLSRRYLDAAHFINTVIFAELNMPKQIKPNDLRGDLPLDVVESILKALPTAIIIGRKEWGKESLAVQANHVLRSSYEGPVTSSEHSPSKSLPPIPGGAVFHLAGILGLEDAAPVLVVKSRVVHYGVISGLFGASAAVCRTLLYDRNAFSSDADAVGRMAAVAKVVSQEKYEDLATKRELCEVALKKFQTITSIHDCKPLNEILAAFSALEARTSLAQQKESQQILSIPQPPDSISALHNDTWSQYSVNIYDLLTTLQQHATGFVVDDSLLNALCRYVFFSTILRVTRPRHEPAGTLEMATVNELLVFGLGLLLHIQDNRGFSTPAVKELRQILESQTMTIIQQNPAAFDDPIKPNEEIVQQLIGRGFNQVSARRSALATKNAGVQQALQWGVANARDPRMNEPIIFVTGNQERVDKPAVKQIMNTFNFAQQFLSGAKTVREWRSQHPFDSPDSSMSARKAFPRRESNRSAGPSPAPAPQPAESLVTVAPALSVTKVVVPPPKAPERSAVAPQKAPPKAKLLSKSIPPRSATASTVTPPAANLPTQAQISPTPTASVPAPSSLPPPKPSSVPPILRSKPQPVAVPPTGTSRIGNAQPPLNVEKVQLPIEGGAEQLPIEGGAEAANPPPKQHMFSTKTAPASSTMRSAAHSSLPSSLQSGSDTRSDHSAVKHREETTLGALPSAPQNSEKSQDDRRRLIEAGRRLLAKSRAENPAPPRKPAPKASPPKATYTPYKPIRTTPTGAASKLIKPFGAVPTTQVLPIKRDSTVAATGTSAAPPPAKQSYFFGKQMAQFNAASVVNTTNTAAETVGVKTTPLPVKQHSPPTPKPSIRLATPESLRPAASGVPLRASTGVSAALQIPPHLPPPPPPPATSRDQGGWGDDLDDLGDGSTQNQNGWGDDLDDLEDLGDESAVAAAPPPPLPPPPPPPPASQDRGGWTDDLDDLGDLGDGSTGDGWDFDESANQGELPLEQTRRADVTMATTATTEPTAEKDDPGLDDGWDDFDDF